MGLRAALLKFSAAMTLYCGAASADDSAAVLMYHRFGENAYPSTNVRVEAFRRQIELLRTGGFSVIPLAQLLDALESGGDLPERAVVLTVDDAYRSVYEVAFPLLREAGLPFTVFVATDPVDDGLADFMSWAQLREMAAAGVTFANHGARHDTFLERTRGEPAAVRMERVLGDVERGHRRLQQELHAGPGFLPSVFAYPYGEYDTPIADALRGRGYVLFGQHSGALGLRSDRRALPRFPVSESYSDLAELRTKLQSRSLPVAAIEPWEPATGEALPRIAVHLDPPLAEPDRLACFVGGQGRVEVEWLEPGRVFRVGPRSPLAAGRHRVNCTCPSDDGRYRWMSHPWFVGHYVR